MGKETGQPELADIAPGVELVAMGAMPMQADKPDPACVGRANQSPIQVSIHSALVIDSANARKGVPLFGNPFHVPVLHHDFPSVLHATKHTELRDVGGTLQ
jgi:hypothetical protein